MRFLFLRARIYAGLAGVGALLAAALLVTSGASAQAPGSEPPRRPLDPLSSTEIGDVVAILRAAGHVDDATRFPIMRLQEPDKDDVLDWHPGTPLHRQAFAEVLRQGKVSEAVVDITNRRVASFKDIKDVQAPILAEEFGIAQQVALDNPAFQAGLRKRGITDFSTLICFPLSAGYFAVPEEQGRRLLRVTCVDPRGAQNPWTYTVENLTAVVDLNAQTVLRVVDSGNVGVPRVNSDYTAAAVGGFRALMKPLQIVQPEGPDFTVDGHHVTWDNWQFDFRVEQRDGLVISQANYTDHGRERPVLYRGSLAETFVPYADPTSNFYYRTYMDEGEYGFGKFTLPLQVGKDCPNNAVYFDVTFADDFGHPTTVPNGVCLFERTPTLLWEHFDIFSGTAETRPGRELVMRFAAVVGNYDYFFDWRFSQDGGIGLRVGAGGIMEFKGVRSQTEAQAERTGDNRYGTLVAPTVVAPFHQHLFNVRLDLDVDGTRNSFETLTPTVVRTQDSPRKSAWVVKHETAERELDAKQPLGDHDDVWVIASANRRNSLGEHTAYTLESAGAARPLLSDDDFPLKRAEFTKFGLWVTQFQPRELYAAGDYPNQSHGGDGLPVYTRDNDRIDDRDIVVWVNVGLTHIPRTEDYPVMPTEWFGSFELKPFGFFNHNPAIDLPPEP